MYWRCNSRDVMSSLLEYYHGPNRSILLTNDCFIAMPRLCYHWNCNYWSLDSDVIEVYFGEKGVSAYESCFSFFCSIPHPTLQLFYLGLIAFGYGLGIDTMYYHVDRHANIAMSSSQEANRSWIWSFHLCIIPLVVDITLLSFLVVSFSNPGVVNEDNVQLYLKCYPCDKVLYHKGKICRTW